MHQASASPTAALASARMPTGVIWSRWSWMIRASTGKAVIAIAVPMKSTNAGRATSWPHDRAVAVPEPPRERRTEAEGQHHGGQRDAEDRLAAGPDLPQVGLPADQEHEEQDAHLGDGRQIGADRRGEQGGGQVSGKEAEQAGAEHDAGEDLGDHRRLAQPPQYRDQRRAG